jgi:hypothetical protein
MCKSTAAVSAPNGTSAESEGCVAAATHANMAMLTAPPAIMVCGQRRTAARMVGMPRTRKAA